MRGTILVVDDRARARRALANELEDAGFAVIEAGDGEEAWERFLGDAPDAVITDMVMPRSDGLELLSRIRSRSDVPVILFTARGSVESTAAAFKRGADDFISSPDMSVESLVDTISRAVRGRRPSSDASQLEGRFAGSSKPMHRLLGRIAGLAPLRTPVLVRGEPGSGRDTVVRAIHETGSTAEFDLTYLDPRSFTPGDPLPRSGAVYLDGIERFSGPAQSYWSEQVAAAEQRGFADGPRIFASTPDGLGHTDMETLVYQELRDVLSRFTLELPPLRSIQDDIPPIADALVSRIGAQMGRKIRLSPSARDFLATQRWPGNVRQLEQVLERAVAFSRGRQIRREVVKDVLADMEESLATIREQHSALERDALLRAIRDTGGNITQTAEILDKSRSAIYRLIEKHGIALNRRE